MVNSFWDTGVEIISLTKEIWLEPTAIKLETLRVRMNEEIKKQLKRYHEEEIITRVRYTKDKLRFGVGQCGFEHFVKTFLYRNFPQNLIKHDNTYVELLKYPEEWISSSEAKQ